MGAIGYNHGYPNPPFRDTDCTSKICKNGNLGMTFDDTSNTPHAVPQALPRTAPNQHQERANQPRHHHQPLVLLGNTPGSCLGSEPVSLINCGSYGGCVLHVLLLGVLQLKRINSMQAYIF